MKIIRVIFPLLIVFLVSSCYNYDRLFFDIGKVPTTPVNFDLVNSEFDDYNSDWTYHLAVRGFSLVFSTNRFSEGKNFDFIYYQCMTSFNLEYGEFRMDLWSIDESIENLIASVNTPSNELGPLIASDLQNRFSRHHPYDHNIDYLRFFYANDRNGNLDIYYHDYLSSEEGPISVFDNTINHLNSEFDDVYPSFHYHLIPSLYFTSNRSGNFDIYVAESTDGKLITQSDSVSIATVSILNSEKDDKCPYIIDNVMVFASDREGGYGGFDLWLSAFNGIEWSEPRNLGNEINSEYDEYRPIIINTSEYNYLNNLMIFSSNRPGGMGGFDLYYVGTNIALK